MLPPDLTIPAERAAYRAELRSLLRFPRLVGLVLVLAGAALLAWPRMGGPWFLGDFKTQHLGWASLALGWAIWIYVIIMRSRYHARRIKGR